MIQTYSRKSTVTRNYYFPNLSGYTFKTSIKTNGYARKTDTDLNLQIKLKEQGRRRKGKRRRRKKL